MKSGLLGFYLPTIPAHWLNWLCCNFLSFSPALTLLQSPCSSAFVPFSPLIGCQRHVCGSAGSSHVNRRALPPASCQNPSICHFPRVSWCFAACKVLAKVLKGENLRQSEARDGRDVVEGLRCSVGVLKVQNHRTASNRNQHNIHVFTLQTFFLARQMLLLGGLDRQVIALL